MNMTLEQLRCLQAAAECGSFSAAARRLGKVQSVVSTTISNLEIDLGVQLFDRRARNPVLTAAGERLLQQARGILNQCDRFTALAGELAAGVESRLTLAVDDDSLLPKLGSLLEAFALRFPDVELELLFPVMEDLTDMLLSGRAQLGISYEQPNPHSTLSCVPVGQIRLPLVCAPSHPLAQRTSLSQSDLQGARQLMVAARREGEIRHRFRLSPQVWWVEGDWAVLELVKRGLGWAAVPEFLLGSALAKGEVVQLEAECWPSPPRLQMEIFWHQGQPLGVAARWLKESLLQDFLHLR